MVGAAQRISEAYPLPVLEAMLAQFPFRIQGFHSDNGSEFINHTVAKLLNKLLIEQTWYQNRTSQNGSNSGSRIYRAAQIARGRSKYTRQSNRVCFRP